MDCPSCGRVIEPRDGTCTCSPRNYVMNAETGRVAITGHPIGVVVEGPPEDPNGRRVDSRPASGGRSYSRTDPARAFTVELSGSLDMGRANEEHLLGVLLKALQAQGVAARPVAGSQDHRGEDALVDLNGRRVTVQVVSVPVDQSIWRQVSSRGFASRSGTMREAVDMVRQAFVHKKDKAAGTLLALDVSYLRRHRRTSFG